MEQKLYFLMSNFTCLPFLLSIKKLNWMYEHIALNIFFPKNMFSVSANLMDCFWKYPKMRLGNQSWFFMLILNSSKRCFNHFFQLVFIFMLIDALQKILKKNLEKWLMMKLMQIQIILKIWWIIRNKFGLHHRYFEKQTITANFFNDFIKIYDGTKQKNLLI